MAKAIKSLLAIAVLGAALVGAAIYFKNANGNSTDTASNNDRPPTKKPIDKPRVEEKYGFTSEGVDP